MNTEEIPYSLVLASDEAYAGQLATTLRSIADASRCRAPFDAYILTSGLLEETRNRVAASLPSGLVSLRWAMPDLSSFKGFSTAGYISTMTYARLLIPQVVPTTVRRVLYLDSDLLVLDDLAQLLEADLEGAIVGAVLDDLDSQVKANDPKVANVPRVETYFNAGVLLIDLERWRNERVSERALEYLIRNPLSPFSDQDALNVACDRCWKRLDSRWNDQAHRTTNYVSLPTKQLPSIVHFVTNLKPWKPSSLSQNAGLYDDFRSRTCFARTKREAWWECLQTMWYRFKRALGYGYSATAANLS